MLYPAAMQGGPHLHTCFTFEIPDSLPSQAVFVGLKAASTAQHAHHMSVFECPADLWFLRGAAGSHSPCAAHADFLLAACHRW